MHVWMAMAVDCFRCSRISTQIEFWLNALRLLLEVGVLDCQRLPFILSTQAEICAM